MLYQPLDATQAQAFRNYLKSRDLIAFETMGTAAPRVVVSLADDVDEILRSGWERDGHRISSFEPPIEWNHPNRSFRFHVQGWDMIERTLFAYSQLGLERHYQVALKVALDWIDQYQADAFTQDFETLTQHVPGSYEDFVWYDMAVGQRSYRLAYITDLAARDDHVDDATFHRMADSLLFHCQLLTLPSFFRAHSNHGFYQALGLAASVRRLGDYGIARGMDDVAREFLRISVDAQFFPEGTHREHSPAYHVMVLGTLMNARREGLLSDEVEQRADRGEEAQSWEATPDGTIATFGDSDAASARVPLEALRYGVRAYHESGYAFARTLLALPRTRARRPQVSYLAQLSGFHSRVHKHADHLTFIWHDHGVPILGDSGRYAYAGRTLKGDGLWEQGFWYSDPRRIYVESTSAHNSVEVDGTSYRRTRQDIFGSALQQAEAQDDLIVFTSKAHYRYLNLWQRRALVLLPGKFLLCVDVMIGRRDHDFRQWFQLDPVWDPKSHPDRISAHAGKIALHCADLLEGAQLSAIHAGETEPMQGWRSLNGNHIEPRPSFHLLRTGKHVAFATLFSLEGKIDAAPTNRINVTGSRARFEWSTPSGTRRITLARDDEVTHVTLA